MIIENGHRYIYAIQPLKGMLALKPRIVDDDIFMKEKLQMANWHKEQIKNESDFE